MNNMMKCIAFYGVILVSATLLSCRDRMTPTKSYWEIEDSIKQAEEDSITRRLSKIRKNIEPKENQNDTILGEIRFGQSNKEYLRNLNSIEKSIGYRGVTFGDIVLYAQNPQFYKGKLYSLEFEHRYYYKPYRSSYNSTLYFNPEPYIQPIVSHSEEKYGLADSKDESEDEIRGHERAACFSEVWIFDNKRITISNVAEQYSDSPSCASYILKIIIDDPKISQEVKNIEEREKEIEEKQAEQKEQIRAKKEKNLLKTL